MLSVSVKCERFQGFQIRRNFQLGLRPCTICCKTANIKSHRIAHNVLHIYTDTYCINNSKENVAETKRTWPTGP